MWLSVVDERGHVVQWDSRPASWLQRACAIAGRDLTRAEWDSYLRGAAYRPVTLSSLAARVHGEIRLAATLSSPPVLPPARWSLKAAATASASPAGPETDPRRR